MVDEQKKLTKIEAQVFDAPGSKETNKKSKSKQDGQSAAVNYQQNDQVRWWHSQFNLMVAVFSLLVLAAFLFVSLSPSPLENQQVTLINQDGAVSKPETSATPLETEQAPWDEKRQAQARKDSQDILSRLLKTKKVLEAQGVEQWANEEYQAALEQADQGDQLYKQQDYQAAIETYENAAQLMESLTGKLPEILNSKIEDGLVAINEGKSVLAKELFQSALTLDKNSIAALNGLARAESLDEVLDLYAQGQEFEQAFKTNDSLDSLNSATSKYKKALELDKEFVSAKEALGNVSALASDKRYRQFMTKGFNNLFARKFASAKSAFSSALKIKPNDIVAKEAYSQSQSSNKSASVTSLLGVAKQHEDNEDWSQALSNYRVVLQRDSNQVSAKLGEIRSKTRNDLEERLNFALSDPLALSKASVREKANQALNDAKGISRKGPRLNQQIAELEAALGNLNQSVKIVFSSDAQTQVTLVKAGSKKIELGKFTSKNLALKPGRYVVTGIRLGFRDVRTEIEVLPGTREVKSISIRCTEPIKSTAKINQALISNIGWS